MAGQIYFAAHIVLEQRGHYVADSSLLTQTPGKIDDVSGPHLGVKGFTGEPWVNLSISQQGRPGHTTISISEARARELMQQLGVTSLADLFGKAVTAHTDHGLWVGISA